MAAYRRVYDSRHLQADCQEPGSAPEPYTLANRVWATFIFYSRSMRSRVYVLAVRLSVCLSLSVPWNYCSRGVRRVCC